MRKVYNLLALVMLLFTGVSAVQAQSRYQITDGDITAPISADAIEEGVNYVIENGSVSANQVYDYVKGLGKSSILTDENLYQFEAAGENANGESLYRLKRKSNGEYLENNNGTIGYTSTQARAWKFKVLASETTNEDDLNNTENPVYSDFSNLTLASPIADGIVLYDADGDVSVKGGGWMFCTGAEGKNPFFSKTNYSTNVICVYTVEELLGYEYLVDALTELGVLDGVSEKYNAGTEPGNISQALYDEMVAAWEACNELITNTSDDQDACVAALNRLNEALAAAKAGVVLVKEGYYYFGGRRTDMDENNYPTNATYDDGTQLSWTYGSTWTKPEVLDLANAKYVWQLILAGTSETGEAQYYIKNFYTGRYIGVVRSNGTHVPSTEAAEEAFYIYPRTKDDFTIESASLRANPFYSQWDASLACTALHQAGDHNGVVMWGPDAEASGWIFLNVPQDELDAISSKIEQDKVNTVAQELLDNADADYQKGFAYDFDGAKSGIVDVEEDGTTPKGLVTTIDQITTNSLETSEGSLEALLDGDISSGNFYHSIWNSSVATEAGFDNTTTYPYLQFELSKAVEEVSLKMWPRRNGDNIMSNNLPGKVIFYATNTPDDEDSWTKIGTYNTELKWKYISAEGETTTNNAIAFVRVSLGAAYKHVRMEVATRNGSSSDFKSLGINQACYNMGEIRVFESAYSAEKSLNSAVPADILNEFVAAKEALQAELDAESATQASIDRLQAAYDNYIANYPDPTRVTSALEAAKKTLEAAEEGDELGYYAEGSKDELQAALDAVEATVKEVMSVAEVNAALESVDAALATFGSRLVTPTDGTWYYLVSKTTAAAANAYVYSAGNGVTRNKWRKMDADENFNSNPAYYWQFIKKADGTYALKNALNGEYLRTPRASGQGAGMSASDTTSFTLVAPKGGIFNLVFANSVYLNAEPTSGNIVTWGSASAEDNSAFAFEEADVESNWDGGVAVNVVANKVSIITLPISVKSDGACYSVLGRNGDKLELSAIANNTIIEAGTPFFYVEEDGQSVVVLDATTADVASLEYATEAKTVNGLAGTLAPISELHVDYGVLYGNETIVNSQAGEGVSNNSGYILPTIATTTETGDKEIAIEGTISAINTVAPAQEASVVSVYTLSGVKVRTNVEAAKATNGLPAGLYIVGQKKVLVK